MKYKTLLLWMLATLLVLPLAIRAEVAFPDNPREIEQPMRYDRIVQFLDEAAESPLVTVTKEGESLEGRSLFLVKLSHGEVEDPWKLFFVGAQHGSEPAGKDALLFLINQIVDNPALLPEDTDLYILPLANPDGAEKDERRNAADADLNRDHLTLLQPETQAMHALQRRIMAHVTVDCHEYTRDSGRYGDQGWVRWPDIMMGAVNHPLIAKDVRVYADRWIDEAADAFAGTDINYSEYYVGGPPPETELRYSTPDADDARNGLGLYNNLSFIIESGVYRDAEDWNADLGRRIDAYLNLFHFFLNRGEDRSDVRRAIESARSADTPEWIPTNFFWGSDGLKVTRYPAKLRETGETVYIETPNFMHDLIVKDSIAAPEGYLISGSHVDRYRELLDHHGIPYAEVLEPVDATIQRAELLRIEEEYDELYNRYDGRQIVELRDPEEVKTPVLSIVAFTDGLAGRRAMTILEPTMLYGLYQFDPFRETVAEDGLLPVSRILDINAQRPGDQ